MAMENSKGKDDKKENRRKFLRTGLGLVTLGAGGTIIKGLLDLEPNTKKDLGSVKIEITKDVENKIKAYVKNTLGTNLADEDILSFLAGIRSKPIKIEEPIPAYHSSGIDIVFVVRKINDIDKLVIEVVEHGQKIKEETFEINELKTPRQPEEPDWHENPKPRKEKPPTSV